MNDYVHTISDEESVRIRRFLRWAAAVGVAFVVLVIVAIVMADRWIFFISHESERRFVAPYVDWADDRLLPAADDGLQAYVENLAQRVAAQMDLDHDLVLEFRVLEGSTVNAFTMLGGYIFVFEGLVAELDDENSLAMVLAHEIAHAGNRDPLLGTGRLLLLQLMFASLSGGGMEPGSVDTGSRLMLNTYSREQEREADRLALAALQKVYGHVGGATALFEQLQTSEIDDDTLEILSSHPNLRERIEDLRVMADEQGWARGPTMPYPPEIEAQLRPRP